jgi:hypothetical protein
MHSTAGSSHRQRIDRTSLEAKEWRQENPKRTLFLTFHDLVRAFHSIRVQRFLGTFGLGHRSTPPAPVANSVPAPLANNRKLRLSQNFTSQALASI